MPSLVKKMYLATILPLNVKDRRHFMSDSAFKGSTGEQEANDAGCLVTSDTDTLLKLLHNYGPH
jgi:hypothetical protein